MLLRACLLAVFACVLALDASQAGQASAGPRGIFVFPTAQSKKTGEFERALAVPGVDGLAAVFDWSELTAPHEPERYDFAPLDRQIALARAHNLAVELVINAGRGVPEWMFLPPPAGLGAHKLHFVYSHHNGGGPCTTVDIPAPWDPIYQKAFANMLHQVAMHLKATDALKDVAVLKLTGMNTQSEELRLPAQTPQQTRKPCVTDSIAIWKQAGYRPAHVQQAFNHLAHSFARIFPDKAVTLPLIVGGGFPPIAENGQVVTGKQVPQLNTELLNRLVHAAAGALPNRLILQQDFLITNQPANPVVMRLARENNLPVAWQTNLYLGGQGRGAGCGGGFGQAQPCNEGSFLKLLQNGIRPAGGAGPNAQARYIEVFSSDALAFPKAVATAHAELTR